MDTKTVLSDNELIAEFMGLQKVEVGYFGTESETQWQRENEKWMDLMMINAVGEYYVNVDENKFEYDLAYDRSFDWLMPVVGKINSINGVSYIIEGNCAMEISSYGARIAFKTSDSMIDTVYKTVVEFIKWYNSTKTL